jgi:hypothetical protein
MSTRTKLVTIASRQLPALHRGKPGYRHWLNSLKCVEDKPLLATLSKIDVDQQYEAQLHQMFANGANAVSRYLAEVSSTLLVETPNTITDIHGRRNQQEAWSYGGNGSLRSGKLR